MLLSKLLQKDFKTVNVDLRYYVSSTSSCFQFVLTLTSYSNCGHCQRFKDFHCLWLYSCVHFYFHVVQVVFSLCSTCLGQSRRLAVGCLACCKQFALEAFLHFPGHPGIWRRNAGVRANTQWMGQRGKEMCEKEMLDPIFKSCLFFMLSGEFLTGSNINIIIPK